MTDDGRSGPRSGAEREKSERKGEPQGLRERTADTFGYVEDSFYVVISVALSLAGAILFGYVVYSFAVDLGERDMTLLILDLLDGLLLVFIITELIHTIRAVIDERILLAEPFLIVGIVAGIRRLVVVSAEAKELLGTPTFTDALFEIGVLSAGVLLLSFAVFLLRRTTHSEPMPAHEPD